MDLKDFISETLTQIAQGIEAAALNLKDSNAVVSPRSIVPTDKASDKTYGYYDEDKQSGYMRSVDEILFDVAVTASEGKKSKGGIGVMVVSIGVGSQRTSESEHSSFSRIKFRIPMVLPNPKISSK